MSGLESLGVKVMDQNELETSITKKANESLLNREKEQEEKRLQKTKNDMDKVRNNIRILQQRLDNPRTKISQRRQIKDEILWFKENELEPLEQDLKDITGRLQESNNNLHNEDHDPKSSRLPDESERDYLVRVGKITAFGNVNSFAQNEGEGEGEGEREGEGKSHIHLREPGFKGGGEGGEVDKGIDKGDKDDKEVDDVDKDIDINTQEIDDDDYTYDEPPEVVGDDVDDDVDVDIDDVDDGNDINDNTTTPAQSRNLDDGDETLYQSRLTQWCKGRSSLRRDSDSNEEEFYKPHPTIPDAKLNAEFKLPGDIYPTLFDYQKTCVQWLWELYSQKTGGIIGDEMGLGKTIQIISFIAGLHYSKLLDKPVLIVVPATVLNQWVNEFHKWWPPLRCIILHSIGSGMGNKVDENKLEEFLELNDPDSIGEERRFKNMSNQVNAHEIVNKIMDKGHVLITTYVGLRIYSKFILDRQWGYCILDEGHKIRNPNLDISLLCKQVRTHNRIILSGTPIQNNLIELWSLFDFIFPGRLGTLPIFEQQFAIPIKMGGYSNASNLQVQTSFKCATILRDLISPYLLRRLKNDVAKDLPKKQEMVLFIKLTKGQQDMYETFLASEDLNSILKGKRNMLMGVDILRKICNHPDLVDKSKKSIDYGNAKRSGKMQVVKNLVQLWEYQKHKILIFCQTKQMLDILEVFINKLKKVNENNEEISGGDKFEYLRMDGSTPIAKRQYLVDSFNNDAKITIFLLTTKVGGLGVNLTGADRIIIFDPDWNPSTDIQARERAWRLGQKNDIVIYRLMIAGSIEEKIYHRQIFKTFLTNKILKDPKQRKFFKMNDLYDLFTLGDQEEKGTETGDMFNSKERVFQGKKQRKKGNLTSKNKSKNKNEDDFYKVANIMGVSKLDKYEGDKEEGGGNEDDRLMEGIFKNNGVHSTVQHDEIINNDGPDTSIMEKEVNKIVGQSIKALNDSRKLTRKNQIGVPTWTGKFGQAGKFGKVNKFGPSKIKKNNLEGKELSSQSILSNIKKRKKDSIESTGNKENNKTEIIQQLIEILKQEPQGFLPSNDIIERLKHRVNFKNDEEIMLIRTILKQICEWESEKKGWRLKGGY